MGVEEHGGDTCLKSDLLIGRPFMQLTAIRRHLNCAGANRDIAEADRFYLAFTGRSRTGFIVCNLRAPTQTSEQGDGERRRGRPRKLRPAPLFDYRPQSEPADDQCPAESTVTTGAVKTYMLSFADENKYGGFAFVDVYESEIGKAGALFAAIRKSNAIGINPGPNYNVNGREIEPNIIPREFMHCLLGCPETNRGNGSSSVAVSNSLIDALTAVKAAGYRVSKPRKPKIFKRGKDRVGPTFVAEFADGTTTRMTTFTSIERLDWDRGVRLSQAPYQSRWRTRMLAQYREQNGGLRLTRWQYRENAINLIAPVPPAIISARFEQDGKVLAQRNGEGVT